MSFRLDPSIDGGTEESFDLSTTKLKDYTNSTHYDIPKTIK